MFNRPLVDLPSEQLRSRVVCAQRIAENLVKALVKPVDVLKHKDQFGSTCLGFGGCEALRAWWVECVDVDSVEAA